MKILYAIQATGNGHLSRAMEIIPTLRKKGEVDILLSGIQSDLELPYEVKYRFHGLSFIFGKKGGVNFAETVRRNNLRRIIREVRSLPIKQYDLIINDFEPISAWAAWLNRKPCYALSNQSVTLSKGVPQPKHNDWMGKAVLKYYAPATRSYGFHFKRFTEDIFTPIIRKAIRQVQVSEGDHYTVYLPAHEDEKIIKVLKKIRGVKWEVFSKHNQEPVRTKNLLVQPIQHDAFVESLASSRGIICAAGFGTPSEALYLKKKLMVIPMKSQFEQHCNAAVLETMGVPVLKSLKKKHLDKIRDWVDNGQVVDVDYPDMTEQIIERILSDHYARYDNYTRYLTVDQFSTAKL